MSEPELYGVPWWRRGVVYQVYVRSFADSSGDGTGDINGLRGRLPYLRDLGVDALWINPWYQSPMADGGYDVADYRSIEPRYGTLADAEALITEAHDHGIRIIADLVPNHTSDQHAWFQEAIGADPDDASRRRYHIRHGRGVNGELPPNNWTSVFGGPAWTRLDDGQWYLHLFAPEQPDLNWENPEVRTELESVLRFWLDRDIDGFRVDVAHGLIKDPDFTDIDDDGSEILGSSKQANHPHWDRDGIHEIVRGWKAVLDTYPGDRMLVAEAWVRPERLPLYLAPGEYDQSFNFDFLQANWDADELSQILEHSVKAAANVDSTPTWVLSNHDVMRETTRYGLPPTTSWRTWPMEGPPELLDVEQGRRRARAACLLMLGLPGSAYIYQGEELGLPEVWDLPVEVLDDPVWERSGRTQRGRDGCRIPLPWDRSTPSAGFSTGRPWLPQPEDWADYSAEAQRGRADSMLELYRTAIAIRAELGVSDETMDVMPSPPKSIVYRRGSGLTCVVNFGPDPIEVPAHEEVLLASETMLSPTTIGIDTAIWLR
ncbi:MAG: glycoside hydrolase family 13 protein [Actinomycetia bacterium]|nr:glycoside hydrolase family 13 protein [Actinomycetes bacterium]MCP5035406.1 glycoside hydrolase family 13 protein [Actinomycetes bacterium]